MKSEYDCNTCLLSPLSSFSIHPSSYLTYKSFRSYTQMTYKPNKLSNKFFELCTDIIYRAKECGISVYIHNK